MPHRSIRNEVMDLAQRLAGECHSQVAQQYAEELARYARLTSACDALESFLGMRPRTDDDVFDVLAKRRSEIADLIAHANLQAYERQAPDGLYLAIPFFSCCSDKQPVWLLNRTGQSVTYLRRSLSAYSSTEDGVDEYQAAGNAFADGIAASAQIAPGGRLRIDDYSMSFDGDFVSQRRIILLIDDARSEWLASVSKLGGHLWGETQHGLHALTKVKDL